METEQNAAELQQAIGYAFNDPALLRRALNHPSAEGENNQRLEFLGDAVLELIISEHLYQRMTQVEEGVLTKIRAAIVTESALARAARAISLGEHIVFGRGEQKTDGKHKPSILSDAFEALIGAVYMDGGYEKAKESALSLCRGIIEEAMSGRGYKNYKSLLQEHFNRKGVYDIRYVVCKEEGPQHNKVFYVTLYQGKKEISGGKGRSKKLAEQDAAKNAAGILHIEV